MLIIDHPDFFFQFLLASSVMTNAHVCIQLLLLTMQYQVVFQIASFILLFVPQMHEVKCRNLDELVVKSDNDGQDIRNNFYRKVD